MRLFFLFTLLFLFAGQACNQRSESSLEQMSSTAEEISQPENSEPVVEQDLQVNQKFYGYWDHTTGPNSGNAFLEHVNVGKSLDTSVDAIVRQGILAIPIISGFSSGGSPSDWRKRLEDKSQQLPGSEHVPFILLIDEPYGKGWNDDQLEQLIDLAKEILPGHRFAYTVKTLTLLNRRERRLPQNADYIGINYYPFRIGDNINSERRFRNDLDRTLQAARQKIDARFFIVGQAFYEDEKWQEPPVQSPLWYANAVRETPDVYGLLWFEWRNRENWKGTRSMPELYEQQKRAFQIINQTP